MMDSRQREYNWNDICKLIWKDMGLVTDEDQRELGEIRYTGNFSPPLMADVTLMRVNVYEKPYDVRTKEHGSL